MAVISSSLICALKLLLHWRYIVLTKSVIFISVLLDAAFEDFNSKKEMHLEFERDEWKGGENGECLFLSRWFMRWINSEIISCVIHLFYKFSFTILIALCMTFVSVFIANFRNLMEKRFLAISSDVMQGQFWN